MGRGVRNTFSYAQVSATLKTAKRKKTDDVLGLDQWKDAMTTKPQGGCPKCDHKIAAFMQIQVSLLPITLIRTVSSHLRLPCCSHVGQRSEHERNKKENIARNSCNDERFCIEFCCCCHFGPLLILAVFGAVRLG